MKNKKAKNKVIDGGYRAWPSHGWIMLLVNHNGLQPPYAKGVRSRWLSYHL